MSLKDRVRSQLTPRELLELEEAEEDAEMAARSVRVPITTFPPTAVSFLRPMNHSAAAVNSGDDGSMRRVNTVPMSLVARALLPVTSMDDSGVSRRRRGDAYICANCRRCDSVVDGGAASGRRTTGGLEYTSCTNGDEQATNSAGIHTPNKCAAQTMFHLQCSWVWNRTLAGALRVTVRNLITQVKLRHNGTSSILKNALHKSVFLKCLMIGFNVLNLHARLWIKRRAPLCCSMRKPFVLKFRIF